MLRILLRREIKQTQEWTAGDHLTMPITITHALGTRDHVLFMFNNAGIMLVERMIQYNETRCCRLRQHEQLDKIVVLLSPTLLTNFSDWFWILYKNKCGPDC